MLNSRKSAAVVVFSALVFPAAAPAALLEALQFTLIDNVVVTDVVPEPAGLSMLAVAAVAGLRRRRRRGQ